MKYSPSRRTWLLLGCVLLALFFIHPGAKRIKSRIVNSISLALGRPVDISSASFRLLPHPGFALEDFVVHDDPAFSAEPILRAQDVVASLRLWSLLHGRLEISRLTLDGPSLNLVRNSSGHWNLEELLQRTAQTAVAPTGKAKTEPRPGFPYIEAESGRINLKIGEEKKPYAVTDADFSLWQESENSWGLRLEGRPVRTDFNLTNTGTIKLNGSWQRSPNLSETPVQFTFEWEKGQLGQITTLAYGSDKDWRGELTLFTQISGTPRDLYVQTNASVDDFRRYDIEAASSLPLSAQCDAHYNYKEESLSAIHCHTPMQGGFVSMEGDIRSLLDQPNYHLNFAAQDVPAQSIADWLAHTSNGAPHDTSVNGTLKATASLITKSGSNLWQGQGEIAGLGFGSDQPFANPIPLAFGTQSTTKSRNRAPSLTVTSASQPGIEIGPWAFSLGASSPASLHGWISPSEFNFHLKGDSQVQRLLQFAKAFAIPSPQTAAEGAASFDLSLAGAWNNLASARTTGTAQLRAIHVQLQGLNAPLDIATAALSLTPAEISVKKLSASLAGSTWQGTLTLPRPCAIQETCAAHFNLQAAELTDATLDSLLITSSSERWYNLLSRPAPSYLSKLRASGQLSITSVEIYKLSGSDFQANADLENNTLKLSNVHAKLLGGKHTGTFTMDFAAADPTFHASGTFDHIDLEKLADLMDDGWVSGSADSTYDFSGSGKSIAAILSSSTAELYVKGRDCTFPHLMLAGDDPLRVEHFSSDVLFSNGRFQIKQGVFNTDDGQYALNGIATLSRDINLKLTRADGPEFDVHGSLSQPRVSASKSTGTRVALKP